MCVTSAKNIWIQKLFLHVCCFLRFDRASVRFLFLEITKGIMSAHFLVIKKGLLSRTDWGYSPNLSSSFVAYPFGTFIYFFGLPRGMPENVLKKRQQ